MFNHTHSHKDEKMFSKLLSYFIRTPTRIYTFTVHSDKRMNKKRLICEGKRKSVEECTRKSTTNDIFELELSALFQINLSISQKRSSAQRCTQSLQRSKKKSQRLYTISTQHKHMQKNAKLSERNLDWHRNVMNNDADCLSKLQNNATMHTHILARITA